MELGADGLFWLFVELVDGADGEDDGVDGAELGWVPVYGGVDAPVLEFGSDGVELSLELELGTDGFVDGFELGVLVFGIVGFVPLELVPVVVSVPVFGMVGFVVPEFISGMVGVELGPPLVVPVFGKPELVLGVVP